jgi:type IV pilus assembly protein PilV
VIRVARGFTLIEVLIAMLVLSVGLLGIAALHITTLRAGRSALLHTEAVSVVAGLAERIRANRVPADAYAAAGTNARATADLDEWHALVAAELPGGTGEIRFASGTETTPAAYTIRVRWTEAGRAEAAAFELRLEI